MKVCVTEQDIKAGQQAIILAKNEPVQDGKIFDIKYHCAIARAFQRLTKDPQAHWFFTCGTTDGKRYRAKRENYVTRWVVRHDTLKKVKPFNFVVDYLDDIGDRKM